MDPAATIARYLTTPKSHTVIRRELCAGLREWYSMKGFHPMLEDVRAVLVKSAGTMPNGWADDARSLGAR